VLEWWCWGRGDGVFELRPEVWDGDVWAMVIESDRGWLEQTVIDWVGSWLAGADCDWLSQIVVDQNRL
jgi:hypothetical protein